MLFADIYNKIKGFMMIFLNFRIEKALFYSNPSFVLKKFRNFTMNLFQANSIIIDTVFVQKVFLMLR